MVGFVEVDFVAHSFANANLVAHMFDLKIHLHSTEVRHCTDFVKANFQILDQIPVKMFVNLANELVAVVDVEI